MNIRRRVITALQWSAAARFLGQAVSWIITIWVIRLLSPADYGLMAMATVLVSLLVLLNTWGLDAVLVQHRSLPATARQQIFGTIILLNMACFAAIWMLADPIAAFYEEPGLAPILRVLALQFPMLVFETLPLTALEQALDFARRSVVDFLAMLAGSLVTLVLALLDQGVWALVWGTVCVTGVRVLGLNWIVRSWIAPRFNLRGLGPQLRFGNLVSLDRGLWFLFAESDKFIGGKVLGSQGLGFYAVANQIASLPIQKITGLLNAIAFPAFSEAHASESREQVRRYLLTASRTLAIVAFPVFFGLAAVAEPLVALLLGDKWLPAAPLLLLLGLIMPLRLLANLFPPLLWGIGKPGISAGNFAVAAISMPIAFIVGAQFGPIGLAWAWLAMYPLVFAWTAGRTVAHVGVGLRTYLASFARSAGAAVVMFATVIWLQGELEGQLFHWQVLAGSIGIGVVVYGLAIWLWDRATLRRVLGLLRR
ncbi:MAG: lipopolysaccharide biosynthesis protein [Pseudomonadota bacterium]